MLLQSSVFYFVPVVKQHVTASKSGCALALGSTRRKDVNFFHDFNFFLPLSFFVSNVGESLRTATARQTPILEPISTFSWGQP